MNHMKFYSHRVTENQMGADPFGLKSVSDILSQSFAKTGERMTSMGTKSGGFMERTSKLQTLGAGIGRRTTITAGIALLYVGFLYLRPIRRRR